MADMANNYSSRMRRQSTGTMDCIDESCVVNPMTSRRDSSACASAASAFWSAGSSVGSQYRRMSSLDESNELERAVLQRKSGHFGIKRASAFDTKPDFLNFDLRDIPALEQASIAAFEQASIVDDVSHELSPLPGKPDYNLLLDYIEGLKHIPMVENSRGLLPATTNEAVAKALGKKNVSDPQQELSRGLRHIEEEFECAQQRLLEKICFHTRHAWIESGSMWFVLFQLITQVLVLGDPVFWCPFIYAFIVHQDPMYWQDGEHEIPAFAFQFDVALQAAIMVTFLLRFEVALPCVNIGVEIVDSSLIYRSLLTSRHFWFCIFVTLINFSWLWVSELHVIPTLLWGMRILRYLVALQVWDFQALQIVHVTHWMRTLGMFIVVCLTMHVSACMWHYSRFRSENEVDWAVFKRYSESLSDATFMITGSQPHNFHRTIPELFFSSVAIAGGKLFLAFVLAKIVDIVGQVGILDARENEQRAMVDAAMDSLHMPAYIKKRVAAYNTYRQVNHNDQAYDALFGNLSPNLFTELKLYLCRGLLRNAPFFLGFPKSVIHRLVLLFEEFLFSPGDIVIRKGDRGNEMYFVMKGSCEIFIQDICLCTRQAGEYFGEISMISDKRRTAGVRAKTYSILAALKRDDLAVLLAEHPNARKQMTYRINKYFVKSQKTSPVGSTTLPGNESQQDMLSPIDMGVLKTSEVSEQRRTRFKSAAQAVVKHRQEAYVTEKWLQTEFVPTLIAALQIPLRQVESDAKVE